jgi:hypothetical protein
MDVHKNYLQVAVLDEQGKVLDNSRVDNNLTKVNEFFDSLDPSSNTKVVMESSGCVCKQRWTIPRLRKTEIFKRVHMDYTAGLHFCCQEVNPYRNQNKI